MTRDTKTIRQSGYTRRSVLQTVVAAVLIPFVRVSATTRGGEMEIKRSGSQPSAKGPAEWFTGTVRIDPLFDAPVPARAAGASVTFEPGDGVDWWRRFVRATSSGSRPARSTGMAQRRRQR